MSQHLSTEVGSLHFRTSHPADLLGGDRWAEIQALRQGFYEAEFADNRDQEEVARFVNDTTPASWDNPNNSRLHGRFGKPLVVAAYDGDNDLRGFAYGANNVSSSKGGVAGRIEAFAKLHVPAPRLVEARYLHLREVVGPNDVVMGAMTALLLESYNHKQPVRTYPYREQAGLIGRLRDMGLWVVPPYEGGTVVPFGSGSIVANQQTRQADSARTVLDALQTTFPEAIAQAQANHRVESGAGLHFPEGLVD